jgi:hypothetical protein
MNIKMSRGGNLWYCKRPSNLLKIFKTICNWNLNVRFSRIEEGKVFRGVENCFKRVLRLKSEGSAKHRIFF